MAFYDLVWYCNAGNQSTTGYYAVALRPQNAAATAGQLVRQFTAPAVNSERVFVCIVAGTTANTTDAAWTTTRGAKTTDGTATWMECTGVAALNGDITNTVNWTAAKAIGTPSLGTVIKRNNGASYQICTTAGTLGAAEPSFSDTAGVTTAETSATTVWTSLGVVGNWTTKGAAPHARMTAAAAANWFAAGNTIYVGDNHAETAAALTQFNPTGSATTIGKFICHDHTGSYPPTSANLMTTATITAASGNSILLFNGTPSGSYYLYGLTFSVNGTTFSFNSGPPGVVVLERCSLQFTSAAGVISLNANIYFLFNNTTVKFGGVAQSLSVNAGVFVWQNTSPVLAAGSTVPTNLIVTNNTTCNVVLEALDLSQVTSIVSPSISSVLPVVTVRDCVLNAALTAIVPTSLGSMFQFVRSDSAATAYKSSRYEYEGTETTETSITRVGGASDPAGQAQSRKIVTTANSQWLRPFKAEPYAIWNPVTGANVTVTVYGTVNAGALPNNDDIWMEVEYLGSSSSTLGTIVNTTKANLLAANAAVASDSSTWNGGGSGAGWSPFKLTTTLSSPQLGMAGYIHVRVKAAKSSATYYIDPQIGLS